MTEPRRLLEDAGTSELQRSLLGSFTKEAPSQGARERTLAALGLPTAVGGAAAAGAATHAASAGTGTAKGVLGLLTWLKWGGGVLALTIVGASVLVVATRTAPTPHASSAAVPARTQEPPQLQPAAGPAVPAADTPLPDLPTLTPESLPRATDSKPRAVAAQRPIPAPSSSGTLMEELALMDRARQSFAQGSYGDAVRAVSSYEARYPDGSFVQEAEFIRVRSLHEQHDEGATAAARAFLTRYPTSPYAPRVRTLVGAGP